MVTSRVVSSHHPTAPHNWSMGRLGLNAGQESDDEPVNVGPQSMVTVAGGRPNVVSNLFRSLCIVGLPNASTMTIVEPDPSGDLPPLPESAAPTESPPLFPSPPFPEG